MALSKSALKRAIDSVPEGHDVGVWVVRVCRAVEAEVRKSDEALILQLVDALESVDDAMPFPAARQVLKVARARLDGMHGIKRGQP